MIARLRAAWPYALLAALAYVPTFVTQRGRIAADSKQLLYVNPGRLLERSVVLWDPNLGAGTVTHQNIGYVFPIGPIFWILERLGVPAWIAQRFWLGSLLFVAGAGVLFLARRLRWAGIGPIVAAVVFVCTPYVAQYSTHLSVLLPPFAALPWLLGCAIAAVEDGGWRWPARFAIVVALVGGINATALAYVLVGPLVWLVWAVCIGAAPIRRVAITALQLGVLTLGVSMWWVTALLVQSRYGLPLLAYTETLQAVALTSTAPEILRGLGYWFFYGRDRLGVYLDAATGTVRRSSIAAGLGLAVAAFTGAVITRWKWRAFFVLLLATGTLIAIGAYPYDNPPPSGQLFRAVADGAGPGLALRSTNRAVPLVVLAIAVLIGAGVSAVRLRVPRAGIVLAIVIGIVALAADTPLSSHDLITASRTRPETIPQTWRAAAAALDERGTTTRYLEVPGQDFAAYTWGATLDPISGALTQRPQVGREVVPYGSAATVDLVAALDHRIQEGTADPTAIAPVARLLSAGDVLVRYDLEAERYRTPRPEDLRALFEPTPNGLDGPTTFANPADGALQVFRVDDPLPIVRATTTSQPIIVAGNGDGLVDAAGVGLLSGPGVVQYSAAITATPSAFAQTAGRDAVYVVTDTNRRRAQRFKSLHDNTGYTERAGEEPLRPDPSAALLEVFPGRGDDTRSVTVVRGPVAAATGYGNTITLTPDVRPQLVLDGNLDSHWEVGAFGDPVGERIRITTPDPVTADRITLKQHRSGERRITAVRLTFDGNESISAVLGPESLDAPGQTITFPNRRFQSVDVSITSVTGSERNGVGFSEIEIPSVPPATEFVRLPTDLLATAGATSVSNPLAIVLTRDRVDPRNAARTDPERSLQRIFDLPTSRAFALTGTARLDARAADQLLAGIDAPVKVRGTVPGDARSRAGAAFDAETSTAWVSRGRDAWVEVGAPTPTTFDHVDISIRNDAQHAWPTRIVVSAGGIDRVVEVARPNPSDGPTVTRRLDFAPLTGTTARVAITDTSDAQVLDWYSRAALPAPVGISELTVPGFAVPIPTGTLPSNCRTDLVTVDGNALAVRVTGTVEDAGRGAPLALEACDDAITLAAGPHEVRTAESAAGLQVDQLAFGSDARDRATPVAALAPAAPANAAATPHLSVTDRHAANIDVRVTNASTPFWLVLGESRNDGWILDTNGGARSSRATLIDGYANGWLVTPTSGSFTLTLRWEPQRWIWIGLAFSAIALIGCCVAAFGRTRRADLMSSPELDSPLRQVGNRPAAGIVALTTVGVAVGTALVAPVWVAALTAAAALGALMVNRARAVLSIGAVALLAVAAVAITVQQTTNFAPVDFDWPTRFDAFHAVVLAALAFLVTDAIVRAVRRRSSSS